METPGLFVSNGGVRVLLILQLLAVCFIYIGMGISIQSRKIIKRLKREGWDHVSTDGDHHNFKKEGMAFIVTVPHPRKDIPVGTLRSIFRGTGWEWPPEMKNF